ncbi:MAG: hypothetical protein E6J90_45205 [Deltaproteobacteria bacterium]|nr:MAG: hypothetical protein E6J90_45205 [Deltaproteobacteria bacterium]TMQ12295.1 MAG: hypothetical protein E6J91_21095 [Deltaproteobacteria bacterium]
MAGAWYRAARPRDRIYEVASAADHARNAQASGDAYHYRPIEPGGVQQSVELDAFKVVGRFTIAEQKNGGCRMPDAGCRMPERQHRTPSSGGAVHAARLHA